MKNTSSQQLHDLSIFTWLILVMLRSSHAFTLQPYSFRQHFSTYRAATTGDDVSSEAQVRPPSRRADSSSSTIDGLGSWEELHGNYVLRPSSDYADQQPRALIHFLGGALVGAAPDLSYRYMLEKLAQRGFLIVATPYTLSFDYIKLCDDIICRFENIAPSLASQYGALPVVGVGHSCGALLHVLITTLFPDTPRAANALLSYNNKSAKDAVPAFDAVVAPFFISLATTTNSTISSDGYSPFPPTSVDIMNIALGVGREALIKGEVPSDEFLHSIARKTTPEFLSSLIPDTVSIDPKIRQTIEESLLQPILSINSESGTTAYLEQGLDILQQIPSLIVEVAEGARDFNPPPSSVQAAARRVYRARRTLLIQYDGDILDESELMESLLRESSVISRMKRPMVDFDIQRTVLSGNHATPCLAPPLDVATRAEDLLGEENSKDRLFYSGADETVEELVRWLEEGQL